MANALTNLFKDFNLFHNKKNENNLFDIIKDFNDCFGYCLYISNKIEISTEFENFLENVCHQKVNFLF